MTNDDERRKWSETGAAWVENEEIFDSVLRPVTKAILDAAAIEPGDRILDVGCGSGTLLEAAAESGGSPVGVDISPAMADGARRRVGSAEVIVADAAEADLRTEAPGPPFDRVVSRFGVMFFSEPASAFANIRAAAAPGATLTFVCWRTVGENPMFSFGQKPLQDRLDPPLDPPRDGSPGPVAFADRDATAEMLESAGWEEVQIDPLDFTCDFSTADSDGVDERLALILGTNSGREARGRLEPELGPEGWAEVLDDIRADLRDRRVDGAVQFPGACWLVRAINPGA